jgi:microcystin-dependent protein
MADSQTPFLKLIKPAIKASANTWGQKLNDDMDKIDTGVEAISTTAGAALQRGGTDQDMRTATEVLFYADPVAIPANMPGAIVSQRWVRDLINVFMPIGMIQMWAGLESTIPAGWALCNGQVVSGQVTPNLTGRFVLQAGPSNIAGSVGGANVHTHNLNINGTVLTWGQMPIHAHAVTDPTHKHGAYMMQTIGGGDSFVSGSSGGTLNPNARVQIGTTGIALGNAGNNEPHNHTGTTADGSTVPAFYALCYIMKVVNL